MAAHSQSPEPPAHPQPQPGGQVEARPAAAPVHAHEGTDVKIRPLFWAAIIFVIFAILTHLGLWGLHRWFEYDQERQDLPMSAVPPTVRQEIVGPRIQGDPSLHRNTPAQDMNALRQYNAWIVSSYGGPAEDGTVRIPIERAIELALERQIFKSAGAGSAPEGQQPLRGTQDQPATPDQPQGSQGSQGGAGNAAVEREGGNQR